jgi:membrane-bound lytic murein transglycosylase F
VGRASSRRRCGRGTLLAALLVGLVGCSPLPRRTSGLDGIRATGELRILVRPGFSSQSVPGDGVVSESELLEQLAARLGAQPRWIHVDRHDQLIRWLLDGRGDLAVGRFSPSDLVGTGASPASAIAWVDDLVVSQGRNGPRNNADGGPPVVQIIRSAVPAAVRQRLTDRGYRLEPVPEEVPVEEVLRRVRAGRYPATVADSVLVGGFGGLEVKEVLAVQRPVVWGLREVNGRLRRAVDDFLFAESVLGRTRPEAACRDLGAVRRARVLRLITRNSPTTYAVERGGLDGFEYRLAHEFARSIGVRLEVEIAPPGIDPMWWLEQGFGDLAALHEPLAPGDEGRFLVSTPYRLVDLLALGSARRQLPSTIEQLAGVKVAAARPVAELCRLLPLEPPIGASSADGSMDAMAAIREVSVGRFELAVVDSDTSLLVLADRPDLKVSTTVLRDIPLVWVFNVSADQLRDRASAFLMSARRSGLIRQLDQSQLGLWEPTVPASIPEVPSGAITPYDEILQWAGRRHGIDWRLLASLMYEESRFDPDAIGPGGSAGLFQFMPLTMRDLEMEDPHHPNEAAEGGAWYLKWLMDRFADLALPDRVAMAIASYNVGPRHLFDARRLAGDMGFDPDRWHGSVETAMLILDDAEVARRYPAGVCRCRRAVGYTRRILRRYRAYTEQFPP